jgi:hypothetical protein
MGKHRWRVTTPRAAGGAPTFTMPASAAFNLNTLAANNTAVGTVVASSGGTGVTYSLSGHIGARGFSIDSTTGAIKLSIDYYMLDTGVLNQLGNTRTFNVIGTKSGSILTTPVTVTLQTSANVLAKLANGIPGVSATNTAGRTNVTTPKTIAANGVPTGWFARTNGFGGTYYQQDNSVTASNWDDYDLRGLSFLIPSNRLNKATFNQCIFDGVAAPYEGTQATYPIINAGASVAITNCTFDMNGHVYRSCGNGVVGWAEIDHCAIVGAQNDCINLNGGFATNNYLSVALSNNKQDASTLVSSAYDWGHSDGVQVTTLGLLNSNVLVSGNYIDDRQSTYYDQVTGSSTQLSGLVSATQDSYTVSGNGSCNFTGELAVGDAIRIDANMQTGQTVVVTHIDGPQTLRIGDGVRVADSIRNNYTNVNIYKVINPTTGATSPGFLEGSQQYLDKTMALTNNVLRGGSATLYTMRSPRYPAGTLTVAIGNTTIQGTGTNWLTSLSAGDYVAYPGVGTAPLLVASVTDDTHFVSSTSPTVAGTNVAYSAGSPILATITVEDNIMEIGGQASYESNNHNQLIVNRNVDFFTNSAITFTHGCAVPPAPTLAVYATTTSSISLSVVAANAAVYEYRMRTTVGPGAWGAWTRYTPATPITGLTNGTSYDFEVVAKNARSDDMDSYFQTSATASITASAGAAGTLMLDSISTGPSAAFAMFKLRSTYSGKCVRVRRASDNLEVDIDFIASSPYTVDLNAISTHCGTSNGYIVTRYDQSGNGRDFTQATQSLQPQIWIGGSPGSAALSVNSVGGMLFSSTGPRFLASALNVSNFISGTGYTIITANRVVTPAAYNGSTYSLPGQFVDTGGGDIYSGQATNTPSFQFGHWDTGDKKIAITSGISFPSTHVCYHAYDGTNIKACVDGGAPTTLAAGNIVTGNLAFPAVNGSNYQKANASDEADFALILWQSDISKADVNTVCGAIATKLATTWTTIP